jgi:hypothetical protein
MTDVLTTLEKARALVEKGWHKGSMGQDSYGARVGFRDPTCCSWCAMGAIHTALESPYDVNPEADKIVDDYIKPYMTGNSFEYLENYNDDSGTTKQDILYLFDRAIEGLKNE